MYIENLYNLKVRFPHLHKYFIQNASSLLSLTDETENRLLVKA